MSKRLIIEIDLEKVEDRYEGKAYSIIDDITSNVTFQMSYYERDSGIVTPNNLKDYAVIEKDIEKATLAYFRVVQK